MGKHKIRTLKNNEHLVEFIRYYKLLPALWNPKCQDYNKRDMRLKAHLLLLRKYRETEPRATLQDVKAKVNTLRSNYRRQLKKVGTTEAEVSYVWWKEMHFISGKEEVDSEIDIDASYAELKKDRTFDEEAEVAGQPPHIHESESDAKERQIRLTKKKIAKVKTERKSKIIPLKTRNDLIEFIRYYKLLPVLWNPKNLDYYNRDIKLKAYLLLLRKYRESEPTATLQDVKSKLNTLRSNYRRYLKRLGTTEAEVSFDWWKEMHFINGNMELDSEIDVEASYEELKKDPTFDEEAELMGQPEYLEESESECQYNEFESEPAAQSDSELQCNEWDSEPTTIKVYTTQNTSPRLIYKSEPQDDESNSFDDEYYCWGKVMITELKKMPPIQQIYAKKAITEILMEGQLGLLHKDSVQINKTPNNQYLFIKKDEGSITPGNIQIDMTADDQDIPDIKGECLSMMDVEAIESDLGSDAGS